MPFHLGLDVILDFLEAEFQGYKEGRVRCLKEGESILNSKHLLCCGVDSSNKTEDVVICSLCLQTSNLKAPPHEIRVTLSRSGCIKGSLCSCKAGLAGACKHVAATLVYINRHDINDLEELSTTDLKKKWKTGGKHPYEGKRIADFCHVNVVPVPSRQSSAGSALEELVRAAPGSALALFERGRGSEPEQSVCDALDGKRQDVTLLVSSGAISCGEPDLEEEVRKFYDERVAVTTEKAVNIALAPQGSEMWRREREVRITGSVCHSLMTYSKRGGDWEKKLRSLEKAQCWAGNSATAHGIKAEKHALELYEGVCQGKLVTCGLLVQPGCPWLGCSPDGVVMHDGQAVRLVEVKSPVCGKTMSAADIISERKVRWLDVDGENATLKKNHQYYGQVQLGMALLKVNSCDLVLAGMGDIAIIQVERDDGYLGSLVGTLYSVYFDILLPHLARQ
ncbi:uncharacterized protein LOC122389961 [Amphibalanus amphitrite]|uniref:uncharacterized protein LOC122377012 n=1 Tax=Amphibalanus amphitrite TaxID=1232801 RepID=UPI001C90F21B|nr:uncharacterized protein LOC122377012 [Amphibalanus amphitrite]XP_043238432.1 uncharacterized protein LOC122389961 [Amphibalanus amphitrite]